MNYKIMYFMILESSKTSSCTPNKSSDLSWLFSDSEIARELGPEMIPRSWEFNYKDNRRMCALMIFEHRSHKELKSVTNGISIQFLFYSNIITYI